MPDLNPIQQQELAAEIARVVALREQEDRQRKALQGNADALVARIQELRAELDQERAARLAMEGKLAVMEVELVTAKRRAREFERVVELKLKR